MAAVSINFNPAESAGMRQMDVVARRLNTSLERLATGKKINRASDDPSGLVASDSLKAQQARLLARINGLDREAQRYGALDGGLAAASDLLSGLNGLIVSAANTAGQSKAERDAAQLEIDSIVQTLSHLSQTSRFNGELILQNYLGAQSGAIQIEHKDADGNVVNSSPMQLSAALASLASGGAHSLSSKDLQGSQAIAEAIVGHVASQRAAVGLELKRIDSDKRQLLTENENLTAAISELVDTDYGKETSELVRNQVLQEAATFSVSIARNLQAEVVLKLIEDQAELISSNATRQT